jgi:NitT/TauT family transport system permease protein
MNLSKNWVNNIIAVFSLMVIWQTFYYIASEPIVFPDLLSIGKTAINIIPTKLFWLTYSRTIITLIEAWVIALVFCAIALSLCLISPFFRKIFEKYCSYFMPLPSFVIIPFITLIFGLGKTSLIIAMVFAVFWSINYQLLSVIDVVKLSWSKHVKNLNWNFYRSMLLVYIPAAAPTIISISNMSWTYMWRVLISIEVAYGAIGGYYGLGTYMIDVKNKLDVDIMYVILFVIALTGVLVNTTREKISKKYSW